jgi:hypothetical protein
MNKILQYLEKAKGVLKKVPFRKTLFLSSTAPTYWFLLVAANETLQASAKEGEFSWREGLLAAAGQLVNLLKWATS